MNDRNGKWNSQISSQFRLNIKYSIEVLIFSMLVSITTYSLTRKCCCYWLPALKRFLVREFNLGVRIPSQNGWYSLVQFKSWQVQRFRPCKRRDSDIARRGDIRHSSDISATSFLSISFHLSGADCLFELRTHGAIKWRARRVKRLERQSHGLDLYACFCVVR